MPVKKKRGSKRHVTKTSKSPQRGKTVAKRKPTRATNPIRDAYKKSQLFSEIATYTDLSRKQVASVFEELTHLIHRHMRGGSAGTFVLPGLLKFVVKHKPATKARKGVNPFTGEMTTFKAKPARNIVKVRALKRLKEMAK